MKRTLLITLFLFHSVWSYAQQLQPLAGVWEIDMNSQLRQMRKQEGQRLGSLPTAVQEQVKSSLSSRKFVFKTDGQFEAYWLLGGTTQLFSGEWELTGTDLLLIRSGSQHDKEYKLYRKGDQMKMVPARPLGNLIETLYLKKEAP